jgi:hypothetical protein
MSSTFGKLFGTKSTPVVTSTNPTGFASLPEFGQKAFEEGVSRASTLAQDPNNFAPVNFNADQNRAFELARAGYQDVNPQNFGEQVRTFSNPFEQQVIDALAGDIRTQGQGVLADIGANATQAGAFGGTRQAVTEAEMGKNILQQIAQTAATQRSGNFQSAADRAIANIGQSNENKSNFMNDLASIGGSIQQFQQDLKMAPQEAINYLIAAAQGLPTGGGGTGYTMRENQGVFGRNAQQIGAMFGAAKGAGAGGGG